MYTQLTNQKHWITFNCLATRKICRPNITFHENLFSGFLVTPAERQTDTHGGANKLTFVTIRREHAKETKTCEMKT
jgi:hypothetical protein